MLESLEAKSDIIIIKFILKIGYNIFNVLVSLISRLGYEIYSDQFSIIGVRSGQCLFLWPGHPVEMR